jgi:hypothetical protein
MSPAGPGPHRPPTARLEGDLDAVQAAGEGTPACHHTGPAWAGSRRVPFTRVSPAQECDLSTASDGKLIPARRIQAQIVREAEGAATKVAALGRRMSRPRWLRQLELALRWRARGQAQGRKMRAPRFMIQKQTPASREALGVCKSPGNREFLGLYRVGVARTCGGCGARCGVVRFLAASADSKNRLSLA